MAWSWLSARRKLSERGEGWAAEMARARQLGALPGVLGEFIHEAAQQAGVDPSEVPAEVWRAAGLDPLH